MVKRQLPLVLNHDAQAPVVSWVYAHGQLESWFGHDVITSPAMPPLTAGIHPMIAEHNGEQRSVIAFVWNDKNHGRNGLPISGLVVQKDDLQALQHAAKKFAAQVW
jgi:hypothetical protein